MLQCSHWARFEPPPWHRQDPPATAATAVTLLLRISSLHATANLWVLFTRQSQFTKPDNRMIMFHQFLTMWCVGCPRSRPKELDIHQDLPSTIHSSRLCRGALKRRMFWENISGETCFTYWNTPWYRNQLFYPWSQESVENTGGLIRNILPICADQKHEHHMYTRILQIWLN